VAAKRRRKNSWDAAVAELPGYLEQLRASDVYGRGAGRTPAPRTHGVYLFTERGKDLYVGRCGVTEKARLTGQSSSNFRARLAGHTLPSSGHNKATFAWRLTLKALGEEKLSRMPPGRAARELHKGFKREFARQKERVTKMEFRVVEITDDLECYVFEPYAAEMLGTPYNLWATH
jgi:hypothetical protein